MKTLKGEFTDSGIPSHILNDINGIATSILQRHFKGDIEKAYAAFNAHREQPAPNNAAGIAIDEALQAAAKLVEPELGPSAARNLHLRIIFE